MLLNIVAFCVFYALSALAYYFNHRYIYHTKPRGPRAIQALWKIWAKFHMDHHRHWKQDDPETKTYVKVPIVGKLAGLIIICSLCLLINPGAGLGVGGFFIVYGIRHGTIHGFKVANIFKPVNKDTHIYKHHMSHHMPGGLNVNHSGVHPFIDRLFGTYHDPDDILRRSSSDH